MPRRNRVDPFGDLHQVSDRGMFTGNRGCLVDESRNLVRHHRGNLWITCVTSYKDWKVPLDQPHHWTPLFFLDDAVALAAGHRPCGLCRRDDYLAYQGAITVALDASRPIPATDQNRRLAAERLRRGRGLDRANDRKTWIEDISSIPGGTVIVASGTPLLVLEDLLLEFDFKGWSKPRPRPADGPVTVLTPPTSVLSLARGFTPRLHDSIARFR
ncbi:MAG TPA: hypothetical protein VEB69_08010 [Acidimicrobiia bacterium]|nr:hypothetical protein [Acidimicrobiia bacterium]